MKSLLMTGAVFAAVPFLGACSMQGKKEVKQDKKPNVLFLFIDDITFNGANALGNPEIISPNIDKIVNSGVNFSNTYIMGGWNGAISIASRSQLITGKYIWNCHADEAKGFKSEIEPELTFPQVMHNAGYNTFESGKWHMKGVRPEPLFDKVDVPRIGGMPNQTPEGYNRPKSRKDTAWQPWDKTKGGFWEGGEHWSEKLADVTINFINENKGKEKPLFLYCAFNAAHDPRQSPKEFVDMYDVDQIKVPKNFLPEHPYMNELGCGKNLRDARLAPFPRTHYAVQKNRQEYYALITHLDVQIGRVIKALKETGRLDNTIIVFAGDNGLSIGHHGLIGKQSMYDHSAKVPLVFSGVGIPKGQTRTQLTYMQDLVPTLYEMLGIDIPAQMQFHSNKAILENPSVEGRDAVYDSYVDLQRMVRDQRYKLFFILKAKKAYLFDMKEDPDEMNDLFDKPEYKDEIKSLAKKYLALSKESGDTLDIKPFFPEIFKDIE